MIKPRLTRGEHPRENGVVGYWHGGEKLQKPCGHLDHCACGVTTLPLKECEIYTRRTSNPSGTFTGIKFMHKMSVSYFQIC